VAGYKAADGLSAPSMHPMNKYAADQRARPERCRRSPWEFPPPRGWSREQFATLTSMWSHYDLHGLVGHPGAARQLLGHDPSSFREAISRNLARAST
jgi:hypothetical protein